MCGYQCHEIGGPWIAENPDCPIHGQERIGERLEDLESYVRDFVQAQRRGDSDRAAEMLELMANAVGL